MTNRSNHDVSAISRLDAVQMALRVLRRTTNLRVAMVVRVTEHEWTACAVLDDANLGFAPGKQLEIQTTY